MSSLAEQIELFTRNIKSIKSKSSKLGLPSHNSSSVAGPFTRAVLTAPLGDLIRDIDPSELGLFQLVERPVPPKDKDPRVTTQPELARVEFTGATPLRKQPARKDDEPKQKEVEPEVYAQAAFKYLERYEPVRAMPRAHDQVTSIIEQLAAVRSSINALTEQLQKTSLAEANVSPKQLADDEERRVRELETNIAELNKRKEAAQAQKSGIRTKIPRNKPATRPGKPKAPPTSNPTPPPKEAHPIASSSKLNDSHEDKFWMTPATAVRALRFTDNIMDESVDLGNVSTESFPSPVPPQGRSGAPFSLRHGFMDETPERTPEEAVQDLDDESESRILLDDASLLQGSKEKDVGDDNGDDDKTVVLKKLNPRRSSTDVPSSNPSTPSKDEEEAASPTPLPVYPNTETPPARKKPKIRVTSEVERIVTKVWSTVGEIIMPGHPFESSGAKSKPPRAKETITHLQTISSQEPLPTSPSVSSVSSLAPAAPAHPTTQQILTAHLLLTLLECAPSYSMSLSKVKDALATKAGAGVIGQGTTRVLYGCVAKKLIKIDRGGGEQVVKFDI